jgi:predicted permease
MPVKETMSDWRMYALSFVRLIICPIVVWFLFRFFVQDETMLGVMTIMASAPVAMIVNVLAIRYDKDERYVSRGIFISTILSAASMPLIIWLLL